MASSAIPKIIYGTAWKKERTTDLVVQAVLQGFRGIDTANQPKHYNETLVGEALKILKDKHGVRREDLFIQTKYTPIGGQDMSQPLPYDPKTSVSSQVSTSFARSQENLGTNFIDSYLLHSPLRTPQLTLEAWSVLRQLKEAGKVGLIGISNCYDVATLVMLETEGHAPVNVVQNRWYEGNGWDRDVLNYCNQHGIQYESFWTLSGSPSLLAHPSLEALAEKHGCTPAQAVFRLAQHWGIVPLAGSKNEQRMRDGVKASEVDISSGEAGKMETLIWG